MRVVDYFDGALQVRWTWLPYWMASNRVIITELDHHVRDTAVLNAITADPRELEALNQNTIRYLERKFPIPGFSDFLSAGYALLRETNGQAGY